MRPPRAWIKLVATLAIASVAAGRGSQAAASVLVPPPNLAQELLSETIPTAFGPFDADTARDFEVRWEGQAPAGFTVALVPGSLQWVRVADVLVLPRGRVRVSGAAAGTFRQAGYAAALGADGEIAIALLSDPAFAAEIRTQGKTYRFRVFYTGPARGWWTDTSCSPYQLEAMLAAGAAAPLGWGYVGCRRAATQSSDHKEGSLQTWWVWNPPAGPSPKLAASELKLDGEAVPPLSPGLWGVRFEPGRTAARVTTPGGDVSARARLAPKMNLGSLGVGLGPYLYRFAGFNEDVNRAVPLLTFYGAYTFTDTVRITAFSATAVAPQWYTNFGLYLNTESFTLIDRRLSFRLMLGAHAIGFLTQDGYVGRFGAPQGVEMVYYDAFARNRNLSLGAFIYPEIDGKSYYNLWLRWGSARFFGELNYISWKETFQGSHPYFSRSVGFSVGFPLIGFW